MTEYFEPGSKIIRRGRGMAQKSLDLIEAMYAACRSRAADHRPRRRLQAVHRRPDPFDGDARRCSGSIACSRRRASAATSRGNGSSMRPAPLNGSQHGPIPPIMPAASRDPIAAISGISSPFASCVVSEKGTVRGLLAPVLDDFAVGFQVMHGFSSATIVHDISEDDDGRPLIILYVGDFDPSGMFMSEEDLPNRFAKYDGDHVTLKRIALTRSSK